LSLAAGSRDTAPSTAAWISSMGYLPRRSAKGATSKVSPGCSRMYWIMDREVFPNTSENTSSSFRLETVRQFGSEVLFNGYHIGELGVVMH